MVISASSAVLLAIAILGIVCGIKAIRAKNSMPKIKADSPAN